MTNFHLVLIKPSHYDDTGYVIRWFRSIVPSNSLAAIYGLAENCLRQRTLGNDVQLVLSAYDETNVHIDVEAIVRRIKDDGGHGLVTLIGVQSNQFPRAMDIARSMRNAGVQVCIGGFHVSGCISMLPQLPEDLREAQALGVSLFAGEAEQGRLEGLLQDAHQGQLKPLYNYINDLPPLEGEITPLLPETIVRRTVGRLTTFDAGRGCPFQCSFCTIINVQGRKSRYRTPDDVERIIRINHAQGNHHYFITDDNFARNKHWEALFDRIIELREKHGIAADFGIQVDTLCHKIPNFIDKAARAGVDHVFIGLENINPDNLKGAKKRQNRITEYRAMLQAWKRAGIVTFAGYMLGFPNDTPKSIRHDIEIIQRELPIDFLEFFILTPLPGSEDHKKLWQQGVWMEPDMNKYDTSHVTALHSRMSSDELQRAWCDAWRTYYHPLHLMTILRRAAANGIRLRKVLFPMLWFWSSIFIYGIHPLEGGYLRRRRRDERRSGFPIERPFSFYRRYGFDLLIAHIRLIGLVLRLAWIGLRVQLDPARRSYSDLSLAPTTNEELELFTITEASKDAATQQRKQIARRRALAAG